MENKIHMYVIEGSKLVGGSNNESKIIWELISDRFYLTKETAEAEVARLTEQRPAILNQYYSFKATELRPMWD